MFLLKNILLLGRRGLSTATHRRFTAESQGTQRGLKDEERLKFKRTIMQIKNYRDCIALNTLKA
jgi:hypothetical protein